jgi:hypothetical protein
MTPDLPTLRALYPEFSGVADATVNVYLTENTDHLSESAWGRCYAKAVLLYTAHELSLSLSRQASAVDGVVPQTGILQSGAEEKITFAFARNPPSTASGEWLGQTPYGIEYQALQRQCLSRGVLSW